MHQLDFVAVVPKLIRNLGIETPQQIILREAALTSPAPNRHLDELPTKPAHLGGVVLRAVETEKPASEDSSKEDRHHVGLSRVASR